MATLEKFTKQPADIQDYDIDFGDWLAEFDDSDTLASFTATAETGITLDPTATRSANVVKVWVTGGTTGTTYKVTVTGTTTLGRVKQVEISIKVKEV
jgi:hypothetical protein